MAQKRMFSLSVVDTDQFLEMPISSRLLYYELGMRADDDGFVDNWKKILMFTGLKDDDLKLLIAKQFIIPFESGVIVIRHWRLNNYLQKDRIKPTIHKEEFNQLAIDNNNVYTLDTSCIHSIDKNSIDKISIDKNREEENSFDNLFTILETNFNRTLSPIEYEIVSKWEDNELTRYAIKEAVLNRAFSVKYVQAILDRLKAKGITKVEEIKKESKDVPKWTNQEIKSEKATEEEIDELKELMKGI